MASIPFFVVVFVCKILASQTIAQNSLSRPVITRNNRRLKGFTFNTFPSASLVSCGLQCQRNPRCVSTNFRKVSSLDETKGICELNERGALFPIEGKDLEHDEESVYTHFDDMKNDCQLTGCWNGRSCTFIEELKVFNCQCKEGCCGVNPVPVGMESGAILDSQITASSEWSSTFAAHQARLRFGRGWAAGQNDNNQWLQVDLQQTTTVTRIATQGMNGYSQWVTEYKLQYNGDDEHTFKFYRQIADHSDTIFQGNTDKHTGVDHDLDPIIQARFIRVLPTKWHSWISMRMELYAC
ncbi:hypothetical protein ACROYT_G012065 [Oculina patagonica]